MKLCVATCQFPTSADVHSNFQYVSQLMKHAREQGAEVVTFQRLVCLVMPGLTWNLTKVLIGRYFKNVPIGLLTWLVNSRCGRFWVRLTGCQYRIIRTTACTSSVIEVNSSTAMTNGFVEVTPRKRRVTSPITPQGITLASLPYKGFVAVP